MYQAPLVAEVYGPFQESRSVLAAELRKLFEATDGIVDIDDSLEAPSPRLVVAIDRQKAALLGVSQAEAAQALAAGLSGLDATYVQVGRETYPIPVRLELDVPVMISGDVHARAWVRVQEIRESIRIIRWILEDLPAGKTHVPVETPPADKAGFAAVEGWRGEIIYWLQSGPSGELNRCMVRDPSSLNWLGLERAITGNIVPDFPLCNKSFNLSYCGFDL